MRPLDALLSLPPEVQVSGAGTWPSAVDVSGLAVAAVARAGTAIARLAQRYGAPAEPVRVDRDLASLWCGLSFTPTGWELPPIWEALAGDYPCADGWIRLHTNAPHHRAAALHALGLGAEVDRATVAAAVVRWAGEDLEAAVVAAHGVAALLRTAEQWAAHPQGRAVAAEPLTGWSAPQPPGPGRPDAGSQATAARPLAGVRVLDLTRIIAGPVATRFLAHYGAQVLRIDPPGWEEASLEAEVTLGKRCARLDLATPAGRQTLRELLAGADLFIHGYRADALPALGFSPTALATDFPHLVVVSLDAYGWSGPWATRRGFDSLVQMSSGLAHAGMLHFGQDRPVSLPVQALDHATGYLCAAAAIDAWHQRLDGTVRAARLSLAATAQVLLTTPPSDPAAPAPQVAAQRLLPEQTGRGPGRRLPWPITVAGVRVGTEVPARGLGRDLPAWAP